MELIKTILNFLTSFFQNRTAASKKEVKLADAETKAVIETIRATENAKAVDHQQLVQDQLADLRVEQEKERVKVKKKSLRKRIDDQFGSDQ